MLNKLGYQVWIGIGAIGLAFIVIFIAWNGAASLDHPQGQIPYLISGGVTALALVILGVGLLLFEAGKRARIQMEEKLETLVAAVREGGGGVAAANAKTSSAAVPNGAVVIGRSSFHRPDCRLVAGKEDVAFATPSEATEQGLIPCRVCDPTHVSN